MDAASFLSSIIEVAIGVAGFAGIIAAIRRRGLSAWPMEQHILLQILLLASAVAIAFALLPAVLAEAGFSEPEIWKLSSTGLILWFIIGSTYRVRQSKAAGIPMPIPKYVQVCALGATVLQVYNITIGGGAAWPYLVGITTLVLNGFACFLLLLLAPYDEKERSGADE